MLSLTVQHNIHLTREQIYALHDGIEIVTIGVSMPVWFIEKQTSEPGREIFCRYYLRNTKEDKPTQILEDGYEITIPHKQGESLDITDEEWRKLTMEDPDKLRLMYAGLQKEASSKNLLDIKDHGSTCLIYREHDKIKKNNSMLDIMHFISIQDISHLNESLD